MFFLIVAAVLAFAVLWVLAVNRNLARIVAIAAASLGTATFLAVWMRVVKAGDIQNALLSAVVLLLLAIVVSRLTSLDGKTNGNRGTWPSWLSFEVRRRPSAASNGASQAADEHEEAEAAPAQARPAVRTPAARRPPPRAVAGSQ